MQCFPRAERYLFHVMSWPYRQRKYREELERKQEQAMGKHNEMPVHSFQRRAGAGACAGYLLHGAVRRRRRRSALTRVLPPPLTSPWSRLVEVSALEAALPTAASAPLPPGMAGGGGGGGFDQRVHGEDYDPLNNSKRREPRGRSPHGLT